MKSLRNVGEDDDTVKDYTEELLRLWDKNALGPVAYAESYSPHLDLINGVAKRHMENFLIKKPNLKVRKTSIWRSFRGSGRSNYSNF